MAVGGLLHAIQFARFRPEPIRQASLLMVLASGISQPAILRSTLRSLIDESDSPWSDRVQHLLVLLEQGTPLSRAVSSVEQLLPEETVIALRIAEDTGTLESTLSGEATRLLSQPENPGGTSLLTAAATLLAVLTVVLGVVTFVMVFIMPKFKEIFEGFNLELPPQTQTLIGMSGIFSGLSLLAWLPTLGGLSGLFSIGWKIQTQLLSTGKSAWLDWRARHRTPMVLRMLSLTTATGSTLGQGLHNTLAEMEPSRAATQLSRVRHDIEAGAALPQSLQRSGFISQREARFLDSATLTGHLDWALRHLAAAIERKRHSWFDRINVVIPPLIILAIGLLVGFIVTALFMPIIFLLRDLF